MIMRFLRMLLCLAVIASALPLFSGDNKDTDPKTGLRHGFDVNAMDKTVSRELLTNLESRNAEMASSIRKKMFTFEDLLLLPGSAIQRIMREIDMRDLTLSLKKSSEALKKLLLGNISRRAAETVQEEIAYMSGVKQRDIEAAQFRIIDAVRKLEAEGEIDLDESRNSESE